MKNLTNGLPAIHPGEYLCEILDDMALTQTVFAQAIGISPMRVSHLLKGQRPASRPLTNDLNITDQLGRVAAIAIRRALVLELTLQRRLYGA